MTYTSACSSEGNAIYRALEQEYRKVLDAYPDASEQQRRQIWAQRKAELIAYLSHDHSTPRSLRKEYGGSSSLEAQRTTARGLAVDIPGARDRTTQATNAIASAPMSRSKGSNSAYLSDMPAPELHQLHGGKRALDESEPGYPASYTYGSTTATWHLTGGSASQQPFEVALNPLDYIQRSVSSDDSQLTAKRQRVEGVNPSLSPYAYNVSPSMSMASSLSPTPFTLPSEPMSRQSSVTSASFVDQLDMMRIGSSFSVSSDHPIFSFDEAEEDDALLCHSFISSAATEVPSSSAPTIRQPEYDVMVNDGHLSVGLQPYFLSDCFPSHGSMPVALQPDENVDRKPAVSSQFAAAVMCRTASEQSNASADNSSASSNDNTKAVRRLQKHIQNGQRTIMSKTSTGPTSIEFKRDAKPRLIRPQEPGMKRKEPIAKQQSYTRPQHPKLMCDLCDEYPNGFRGDHELKRHKDRSHTQRRKVWICVDPPAAEAITHSLQPKRPLNICKQCKQQKTYNVYYNAAAHLRRAHFYPRKRGRKARGEKPEKRAGKAGGDYPPIGWLKEHGYLKEIEVGPETTEEGTSLDGEDEEYDDFECVPPLDADRDQNLPAGNSGLLNYDFGMELTGYMDLAPELDMGLQWMPTAPTMQHSMSAPATMMMTVNGYDGGFYSSSGFGFAVDAAFGH